MLQRMNQPMTYEDPVALAKIVWKDLTTGVNNEYVLMEGATATIGRSKHNDICVPERHVSRRHAVIHFRPKAGRPVSIGRRGCDPVVRTGVAVYRRGHR
jgi:hypothetical protein